MGTHSMSSKSKREESSLKRSRSERKRVDDSASESESKSESYTDPDESLVRSSHKRREQRRSKSYRRGRDSDSSEDDKRKAKSNRHGRDSDSSVDDRRRSKSSKCGRDSDSSDDDSNESNRGCKKQKSSRKITQDEIVEYLAKKAQRKAAKVGKKLKAQKVSGYSNNSNPFGDSNLNEKFVW